MRLDFFRRSGSREGTPDEVQAMLAGDQADAVMAQALAETAQADGYVTYAQELDAQMRVQGYRFHWRAVDPATDAAAQFRALATCLGTHLHPEKGGWRLGRLLVYLDVTVEALFQNELQLLPPANVVLCMGMDDLADADTRSMLLFLREQGFGFMLRGASVLPHDPALQDIITHVDVGAGSDTVIAGMRRDQTPGREPMRLLASRIDSWDDFERCAAQGVGAFVEGAQRRALVKERNQELQPESMLIVRLMQMLQRDESVKAIESALKRDAALTYRLLRHINSPAIGAGVEITSLRHAVALLGYSPLFRWLTLLLATSNKASSPFMMKKAILRGRFVELMGQGMLPASEADNLFVVGMFSLIDQLLGVPMHEVLQKVQLADSVQQAILSRQGVYAPFLALVESCESNDGEAQRLAEALFVSAGQVNAAHLSAMAWSQEISAMDAH